MARIRGKIVNPVSIDSKITTEIEAPINTVFATNINYQASSLSTFLETKTALFLPIDLSRIDIFLIYQTQQSMDNHYLEIDKQNN